ncbi:choice-of-anchor I family protein [Corynebacterium aquatimens]|uniref:choice-of-anchor I family protein n=1 Tax=Corynebacterium aquatimens TaxID=1190508 RepID=UPI0025405E2C|nr:choice-of-anchor I family protein [Corynebacterium aquatimens]
MTLSRSAVALTTAAAVSLASLAPASAAVVANPTYHQADAASVKMAAIGSYGAGIFNESAAEIVAYHPASKRILTVNANSGKIDVLDAADPTAPQKIGEVFGGEGTTINSVSVRPDGLAVATVEPSDKTAAGEVIFFNAGAEEVGAVLGRVGVGSLPDMVTVTPDGKYALVANEGEPAEDYSVDPEGSVSVIALPEGVAAAKQEDVRTAGFTTFNEPGALPTGVHIFGQVGASTTVAQNLEPEYIAVDGGKAYVTLQENNAIAVVDIAAAKVERIFPLGYQDRLKVPADISDKDKKINIANWPVKGILQPDSIAAYNVGGKTYLVTANEGDARDWEAYSEEARVKDLGKKDLAPICEGFNGWDAEKIKDFAKDENAGRLKITTAFGLDADKGCYNEIYAFGGRSFSIFDAASGERVFDSGAEFETITSKILSGYFNTNHSENGLESRSDDKSVEPEGVAVGEIDGRTYAFIGFERLGGVMVYDITDPAKATYQAYINNRDFTVNMEDEEKAGNTAAALAKVGDLGAEGLAFVPAKDSLTGRTLCWWATRSLAPPPSSRWTP